MNKAKTLLFALLGMTAAAINAQRKPCIPRDEALEAKVESTLSKMSLDDKVGQMLELTIDMVIDDKANDGHTLSEAKLQKAFDQYKTGSILNVPHGIAQTPSEWAMLIRQLNQRSMEQCNGIPEIYGVDCNHGASYTMGATFFPQEIAMAASFNRDLVHRVGEITAYESRACLIPWVYNPVMDLGRQPLWSRMWESFGEDSYVNAEMGVAFTRGYQGDDPNHIDDEHVAVSIKHYFGYGIPASGKDRTPAYMPERELRERYFEPFRRCAEAGALTIMVNSSIINGIPMHANRKLITQWLKEEMNWDGMVVTDWADIDNIWKRDHIAASKKDAIALAINAGVDMSMDPYDHTFCDKLKELVMEGRVPMTRIDDAVRRILRLKYRLGLFDKKTWDIEPKKLAKKYNKFASAEVAAEAVKMAEECMVLLKNKGDNADPSKNASGNASSNSSAILPLKAGTKILCVGPNADNFRPMNGGWSYTWQGDKAEVSARKIGKYKTFYQALSDKFGADNVKVNKGLSYDMRPNAHWSVEVENDAEMNFIPQQAQWADVIIAFVGENSYCETPGNTDDLYLSVRQRNLVKRLAAFKKPIVLVLNEGRPRLITDIEPLASAVVDALLPSNYGGEAIANLFAGEANFSGKLPFTYPKFHGSFATYDYKPSQQVGTMAGAYDYSATVDELYPFGYGMSYTTFKYGDLHLDKTSFRDGDTLNFTIDVTNTGTRAGKEAVLLYVSDLVASITPDNKRLRAFTKIELQPGETKTVSLPVKASDLAFVGIDNTWILEPGEFIARCGGKQVKFVCEETKEYGVNR